MGCNKVCKAKKQAKKEKAKADKARNAKPPSGPKLPKVVYPKGATVKIATVGHILGVHEKKGALTPQEMYSKLNVAKRNRKITRNSTAKGLITPLKIIFGTYTALIIAQIVFNVLKPIVKLAVNINGIIVFNFANLGELIGDIGLLILTVIVGLTPIFLRLLKNIFLSIPIDTSVMSDTQMTELENIVSISKVDVKKSFTTSVANIKPFAVITNYNNKEKQKAELGGKTITTEFGDILADGDKVSISYGALTQEINTSGVSNREDLVEMFAKDFDTGMVATRELILEDMNEELEKMDTNILDITDVSSMDLNEKTKIKEMADGFVEATKKIETAQGSELLTKQFNSSGLEPDENYLAETVAENIVIEIENNSPVDVDELFLMAFSEEVEKKKTLTIKDREDINSLDLAEQTILDNKQEFKDSIIEGLKTNLTTPIVVLDICAESSVAFVFQELKNNILIQQTSFINTSVINTEQDMLDLCTSVFMNAEQLVVDSSFIRTPECNANFKTSICVAIKDFKNLLFADMKKGIEESNLNLTELPSDEDVDKLELKSMVDKLLIEVKKALAKQARDIIISEIVPCKSCRACDDMTNDILKFIDTSIIDIKATLLKQISGQIIAKEQNWEVSTPEMVIEKKTLLVSELTMALQKESGVIQVMDEVLFRLRAEELELRKNVISSMDAI